MFRKYVLPVLSVFLLGFAVLQVVRAQQEPPKVTPPVPPAQTPFGHTVAGAGIVEARSENISIGSALAGVVTKVHVKVGTDVQAGELLFELDDRQLQAELTARETNLRAAQAQLERQLRLPRPEEVPSSAARVRELEANLADNLDQMRRTQQLVQQHALGEEELVRHQNALRMAREQLARAKADLDLLNAGAWEYDKEISRAAVAQMEAQVNQTRIDLERLKVKALVPGRVLQVNVRPGEYVGAPPSQALIVLGEVKALHVRVDVDEHDIPRFRPGQPAYATLRGAPGKRYAMTFVRVEPYVVPKKSLTGDNTERVDTRVLQVIYALEEGQPLYVGQQMDVFIDAAP